MPCTWSPALFVAVLVDAPVCPYLFTSADIAIQASFRNLFATLVDHFCKPPFFAPRMSIYPTRVLCHDQTLISSLAAHSLTTTTTASTPTRSRLALKVFPCRLALGT